MHDCANMQDSMLLHTASGKLERDAGLIKGRVTWFRKSTSTVYWRVKKSLPRLMTQCIAALAPALQQRLLLIVDVISCIVHCSDMAVSFSTSLHVCALPRKEHQISSFKALLEMIWRIAPFLRKCGPAYIVPKGCMVWKRYTIQSTLPICCCTGSYHCSWDLEQMFVAKCVPAVL